MLRVGIDLRVLGDRQGSGVATYTKLMLQALGSMRKELTMVGYTSGLKTPELNTPFFVRHRRAPNQFLNIGTRLFGVPRATTYFTKVACVWQPNPLFFPTSAIPHFVTLHDLSLMHYPQFFSGKTKLWYAAWVHKFFSNPQSNIHIVAVSEHTRQDFLRTYNAWPEERVHFVPAPAPQPTQNKKIYTTRQKPYFLFLSNIEPRKNISSLLEAWSKFYRNNKKYSLVIAGRGGLKNKKEMKGVVYRGYISDKERQQLLANAFCLCYPSYDEGFGYPPLEAGVYRVPAIVSANGALPETLGDAALYVNPYYAADEFVSLWNELAVNPVFHEAYGNRLYERVRMLRQVKNAEVLVNLWKKYALV